MNPIRGFIEVDMEAGVEHFGRGVETSVDTVLVVVEPPLESVNVAEKIYNLASEIGIKNVVAILNKVPSDEIGNELETELCRRNIPVVGCIHFDPEVFRLSIEGSVPTNGRATKEIKDILALVLARASDSEMQ
jgi:CO dehydrogenase maturation factor